MGIDWILGGALLVGGALLGGVLVRIFGVDVGRENELKQELDKARKEFTDYRGEVEAHFRETAEAVNAMTESYRVVYDKLRGGASRLCGEGGNRLDFTPVARLENAIPDTPPAAPEPAAPESTAPEQEDTAGQSAEAQAEEIPAAAEAAAGDTESSVEENAATSGEDAATQPDEPRAPLDYASDGDGEDRDKILH